MRNRLLASPKLKGALAKFLTEAFELGYIPSINNTQSKKLCIVVSNHDSGKCALLGTTVNKKGDTEVSACTIDVPNWLWAESEGFTRDEIVDNDDLCRKIFKRVPVALLAELLA